MIILSKNLKASSRGQSIETPYRAIMFKDKQDKWIVKVEQFTRHEWRPTGGAWRLTTLLHGYPANLANKPSDSIYIDFGQEWRIDSGMLEALNKAIDFI